MVRQGVDRVFVVALAASAALVTGAGCSGRSRSSGDPPSEGGGGGATAGGASGAASGASGMGGVSAGRSGMGGDSPEPGGMGGAPAGHAGASGAASGGGGAGGNGGANVAGSAAGASGSQGGSNAGSGGAGKAGAGGGGGIASIVGALDGRFIEIVCGDSASTDDCNTVGYRYDDIEVRCSNAVLDFRLDHPIGGTPGATYLVTMHFYGILEAKNYGANVTRESGSTRPQNLNTGANPAPWASAAPGVVIPVSVYNTYEVRVFDQKMTEVGVYFVNSDTQEGHYTYVIDFERTIPVVGGGVVRLASYDYNCRMIKNCGATPGGPCSVKARTVAVPAIDPPLPADFEQPVGATDYPSQWWLIDVTRVAAQ